MDEMLRCLLLCVVVCGFAALQEEEIKAIRGDNVTLRCKIEGHSQVRAVLWAREDISGSYVVFKRDSRLDPEKQDPSYGGRVDLLMTDGEVFITISSVSGKDSGTYECFIAGKTIRQKRHVVPGPPICRVTLGVVPDQPPFDGHGDRQQDRGHVRVGVIIVVSFFVVLVLGAIIVPVLRNKNHNIQPEMWNSGSAESQVAIFTTGN